MKKCLLLLLVFLTTLTYAQDKVVPKPGYVIIINNEIVTKAQLDEYAKSGSVKSITKGVSQEQRDQLAKQFGEQIGSKEFIVLVTLFTDAEKEQRAKPTNGNQPARENDTKNQEVQLNVNDVAKDFRVEMLDGTSIQLSDLKGKVVLINFWATWCAPCLMEFHDFPSMIIEPFKDSNFVLLAIARGEDREKVAPKMANLKNKGIDFNVGMDPGESIWKLYAEKGIPKNFLVDQDGIIRYVSTGYYEGSVENLAKEIRKLLD